MAQDRHEPVTVEYTGQEGRAGREGSLKVAHGEHSILRDVEVLTSWGRFSRFSRGRAT